MKVIIAQESFISSFEYSCQSAIVARMKLFALVILIIAALVALCQCFPDYDFSNFPPQEPEPIAEPIFKPIVEPVVEPIVESTTTTRQPTTTPTTAAPTVETQV